MRNVSDQERKSASAADIEAVITSYNQGTMVLEAVQSLYSQTVKPARILIVDDGSTDAQSVEILKEIEADQHAPVPVEVVRQPNSGVSAARNAGIRRTVAPMVLVLDGDDRLEPEYIEKVGGLLRDSSDLAAASSWMQTFGVMDAVVQPAGGEVKEFLSRNCCPATHILRREIWEQCGGYDESMRSGFEDWDFFLGMLETGKYTRIGIVEEPLISYRTAPASSNVRSMEKRLELMRYLIGKHNESYRKYLADALLGIEKISMGRLFGWETEIMSAMNNGREISEASRQFLEHPTYGDGGMAAAVRIRLKEKN